MCPFRIFLVYGKVYKNKTVNKYRKPKDRTKKLDDIKMKPKISTKIKKSNPNPIKYMVPLDDDYTVVASHETRYS